MSVMVIRGRSKDGQELIFKKFDGWYQYQFEDGQKIDYYYISGSTKDGIAIGNPFNSDVSEKLLSKTDLKIQNTFLILNGKNVKTEDVEKINDVYKSEELVSIVYFKDGSSAVVKHDFATSLRRVLGFKPEFGDKLDIVGGDTELDLGITL